MEAANICQKNTIALNDVLASWKFWILLETSKNIFTSFDLELVQSVTKKPVDIVAVPIKQKKPTLEVTPSRWYKPSFWKEKKHPCEPSKGCKANIFCQHFSQMEAANICQKNTIALNDVLASFVGLRSKCVPSKQKAIARGTLMVSFSPNSFSQKCRKCKVAYWHFLVFLQRYCCYIVKI